MLLGIENFLKAQKKTRGQGILIMNGYDLDKVYHNDGFILLE